MDDFFFLDIIKEMFSLSLTYMHHILFSLAELLDYLCIAIKFKIAKQFKKKNMFIIFIPWTMKIID